MRELLATTERDIEVFVVYSDIPFALLPTLGALVLLRRPTWSPAAAFAIIFMGALRVIGIGGIGRYAASCWPAFLPLGAWLARHPLAQGPALAVLALFQGRYFYLFTQLFFIL